jgi:RHH-type rel operon transcriptional repressor/antitoxin RelB
MLAVRVDKEIEQQIDMLAKAMGSSRSAVVREAILRYLEDNEDLELAGQALSAMRSTKPLAQVRKELGLDG